MFEISLDTFACFDEDRDTPYDLKKDALVRVTRSLCKEDEFFKTD